MQLVCEQGSLIRTAWPAVFSVIAALHRMHLLPAEWPLCEPSNDPPRAHAAGGSEPPPSSPGAHAYKHLLGPKKRARYRRLCQEA